MARFPKGMNRGFPWCKDSLKCQSVSRLQTRRPG
jgi:hypothetical protein